MRKLDAELYDVAADPLESRNLIAKHLDVALELLTALRRYPFYDDANCGASTTNPVSTTSRASRRFRAFGQGSSTFTISQCAGVIIIKPPPPPSQRPYPCRRR